MFVFSSNFFSHPTSLAHFFFNFHLSFFFIFFIFFHSIFLFIYFLGCPASSGGGGSGNHGTDVSQLISTSSWTCLKNQGYKFAVVRAFQSTGNPDANCPTSVANAHNAGISPVDVYMFPCPKCSASASSQVSSAISYLKDHSVKYSKFWLDIEGTQYWSSSTSTNPAFFNELVKQAKSMGASVGVYTSSSQWGPIMGSSFHGGSDLPLWYAHYVCFQFHLSLFLIISSPAQTI